MLLLLLMLVRVDLSGEQFLFSLSFSLSNAKFSKGNIDVFLSLLLSVLQ